VDHILCNLEPRGQGQSTGGRLLNKMLPKNLRRHIYLRQLQDTNETLFYRLLLDHLGEMMPIAHEA
jgi:hypothetical protein